MFMVFLLQNNRLNAIFNCMHLTHCMMSVYANRKKEMSHFV